MDEDEFMELNYYKTLGVDHLGFSADNDQIKRAYHKMLLIHHPDKTGRGETDPIFLRIQDAYNTLTSTEKRRAYDSQCDFDEKIPDEFDKIEDEAAFYKLYGPVFSRYCLYVLPCLVGV